MPDASIDQAFQEAGIGYGSFLIILITGMIFCADSAEISLITYMIKDVQESFALSDAEVIFLEQVAFLGQLLGPLCWGRSADLLGRRPSILLCACMVLGFGLITACAQSFLQLMIARAGVGFGISGIFLSVDIACELLPKESAGRLSSALNFFWPVGSVFTILCTYLFLETWGWRALACCCSFPMFSALGLAYAFLPESPHWLLEQGRSQEAMQSLKHLAQLNGVQLSLTGLYQTKAPQVDSVWRRQQHNLLILMFLWLFMAMNYLSAVLLGPMLLTKSVDDDPGSQGMDFMTLGLASLGEVLSVALCFFWVDRWGRRHFQAILYAAAGGAAFFLGFHDQLPYPLLAAAAILARCGSFSAGCATWLHTPEVFPVQIRATAHAACNMTANLGRLLAPLLVSPYVSGGACGSIMTSSLLCAAALALATPETRRPTTDDFNPSSYKALRQDKLL